MKLPRKSKKMRLDKIVFERELCESRHQARGLILAGQVIVDDEKIDKAGAQVREDAVVRLKKKKIPYVSRGGLKLEAALHAFDIDPKGKRVLDLGASTGGFTDCLLQRGAHDVTAVDVGYGQLHNRLRSDPRVHCIERMNARYLRFEDLPLEIEERYDVVVADLSFISLRLILEAILPFLDRDGDMVLLVKPQFEVGRGSISKGGVVRDHEARQESADRIRRMAQELGLVYKGQLDSPIHGPKGNIEILMWLKHFH